MPLFGRSKKPAANGDSTRLVDGGRGDAGDYGAGAFASETPAYGQGGNTETVERVPRTGGLRIFGRRNSQHGTDEAVSPPATSALVRRESASRRRAAPATTPTSFVTQTIGFLCGTGRDDWTQALRLADEVSGSESLAKEAARSLRKEVEHGLPEPQMRAARLLVILCRNSSDRFRLQIASKRFLDVYVKVAQSKKLRPDVKAMLLKALSVLAYEYQNDHDLSSITDAYNRIKEPTAPLNGLPLDPSDTTFEPMIQSHPQSRSAPVRDRSRIDLWEQAEMARSNAQMLSETLAYTKPEELEANPLIREFYAACQKSQEVLVDAIPWATTKADERRMVAESGDAHNRAEAAELGLGEPAPRQQSHEESLLAILLSANQDLIDVFRVHDDLERQKRQIDEEHEVAARSLVEQKFDRTTALETPGGDWLSAPVDPNAPSGSRSPSPVHGYLVEEPSPAPPPVPAMARPSELPRGAAPASRNPYAAMMQPPADAHPPPIAAFARPAAPPVEIPPRAPSPVPPVHDEPDEFVSSLPERQFASHNPYRRYPSGSSVSSYTMPVNTVDDGESLPTPVEPSAKALGKLRRLSARADDDGAKSAEQQAQLEAALRARYALNRSESARRREADDAYGGMA